MAESLKQHETRVKSVRTALAYNVQALRGVMGVAEASGNTDAVTQAREQIQQAFDIGRAAREGLTQRRASNK